MLLHRPVGRMPEGEADGVRIEAAFPCVGRRRRGGGPGRPGRAQDLGLLARELLLAEDAGLAGRFKGYQLLLCLRAEGWLGRLQL